MSLLLLLVLGISIAAFSQEKTEEFKPNGKPLALIFTNFHTALSDGETASEFENTRAYLGYEYNFSEDFYAKVVFDVGDPKDGGGHQLSAFLKNAYVQYSKDNLKFYFGMISTTQFKASEKLWGNRYMMKSYQDEYKFNSSADLGFNIDYKFADFISADFSVINGEGYKKIQGDDLLRYGAGTTIKPVKNVLARVFVDQTGDEVKQKSLATLLAYTNGKFTLAGEYNYQSNYKMVDGQNQYGTSFYSWYKPNSNWKLFARYDDLNSDKLEGETEAWNISKDGQLMIAGVEYSPVKGVKFTPNVRFFNPDQVDAENITYLYLSAEFKF
ncbi:hypothetical protein SLH46_03105 [Draconibacterium sp. IB214405]|uniref:hypothetical protein n=1 Tax=Draconibacterium sp. IB214405 TaxID=3097352 RepID=UPI002A11EC45|nr:hypothetical protein [Draconibacterium sp. IB214405]MDX8338156.1 hypothetical protein [Draconibacterium sp. IB214405]